MLEAFRSFGLKAESAQVAMVFYAGHGIQVAGENYLLPIDARLERERDLLYEALPLNVVLGEVAQAERLGLVVLDACRDNPLAEQLRRALGPIRSRMVGDGLARVESLPSDTIIAFSTKPGEVAVDGTGEYSPYSAALLQHIEEPGVELGLLFRKVRDTVLEQTAYRQEPRTYDALGAEPFYFKVPKPNQRPEMPEVATLEVLDNLGSVPLGLPPPSDPDEDRITAQVVGLPGKGTIQLGDRELLIGDVLTVEQLGTLNYHLVPGDVGNAGSFDFVVKDDRGGAVIGRMPIQVARANQPPVLEVTRLLELPAIPLNIDKPADPEGDPLTVTILEVPERGEIKTGDRVLGVGDEITPDELAGLMLDPGAEGSAGTFAFKVADPYGASATSSLQVNIPGLGAPGTASIDAPDPQPASQALANPATETPEAPVTTALAMPPDEPEARPEPASPPEETEATPEPAPQPSAPSGQETERNLAMLPRVEPATPEERAIVGEYEALRTSNIRRGPSVDTERVATVLQGASLRVIGTSDGRNWYRVRTQEGIEGFIYGELIRPKPGAPEPEPEAEIQQAAVPLGRVSAEVIKDCPACPVLVQIPRGSFRMGSDQGHWSERPVHRVTISAPFALGRHEVTVGQWEACVGAGACNSRPDMNDVTDDTPVHNVSWDDAQDFVGWLRDITGKPYRLPTEAEWEYAARAGTATRFWWGDSIGQGKANCQDCGGTWDRARPVSVGSYSGNPFGLHDMNGGVMEWVADCWVQDYGGAPSDGSARAVQNCQQRALRGGSWRNDQSYATASSRLGYDAGVRYYTNGFRVARDLN
jgi:formylglycine-generating enzyme required for sulfatase activity